MKVSGEGPAKTPRESSPGELSTRSDEAVAESGEPEESEKGVAPSGGSEYVQVARSVSTVSFARILFLGTSLLRTAAIAGTFGAGAHTDAFFVALFIPEILLQRLLTPLMSAFVPVFVEQLTGKKERSARRLVWTFGSWILLACLGYAVFGYLATELLVGSVASGLSSESKSLARGLVWILLPMVFFTSFSHFITGILGTYKRFAVSAFAPVVFNLVILGIILGFGKRFGIEALAVGFLLGAGVQLALQVPTFLRHAPRPGFFLRPSYAPAGQVLWLMVPILLDTLIGLGIRFVENNLASHLSAGSLSSLSYAVRLYGIPIAVFSSGLTTVIFPYLSTHFATDDATRFRKTMGAGLRALLLICIPISVLFIFYHLELVSLCCQYGVFDESSVERTARVFRFLVFGLTFQALSLFFCRVLYALKDTLVILRGSVVMAAFNVGFDVVMVPRFGVEAIALGAAFAWMVHASVLIVILARRHQVFDVVGFGSFAWRALLAGALLLLTCQGVEWLLPGIDSPFFKALIGGGLGFGVFLTTCAALRVNELTFLVGALGKKLGLGDKAAS